MRLGNPPVSNMRFVVRWLAALALVASAGCFLRGKPGEMPPPREPIPVQVKNENFLDVNVYANVGSQSRRLGIVTGNSTGRFMLDWSATVGQSIVMSAIPIGGGGRVAASQPLNVGSGQMIYFTVASVLRQSTAMVGDP